MITAIEGILTRLDVDSVDISIGGVTLKTYVPQSAIDSLGHLGDKVKLFTSLQFRSREDTLTLFHLKQLWLFFHFLWRHFHDGRS